MLLSCVGLFRGHNDLLSEILFEIIFDRLLHPPDVDLTYLELVIHYAV